MHQVLGKTIGQGSLKLGPDKLIGVKLRGVAGEEVGMDPGVFFQELLDGAGTVGSASVPEKDQRASDMP